MLELFPAYYITQISGHFCHCPNARPNTPWNMDIHCDTKVTDAKMRIFEANPSWPRLHLSHPLSPIKSCSPLPTSCHLSLHHHPFSVVLLFLTPLKMALSFVPLPVVRWQHHGVHIHTQFGDKVGQALLQSFQQLQGLEKCPGHL